MKNFIEQLYDIKKIQIQDNSGDILNKKISLTKSSTINDIDLITGLFSSKIELLNQYGYELKGDNLDSIRNNSLNDIERDLLFDLYEIWKTPKYRAQILYESIDINIIKLLGYDLIHNNTHPAEKFTNNMIRYINDMGMKKISLFGKVETYLGVKEKVLTFNEDKLKLINNLSIERLEFLGISNIAIYPANKILLVNKLSNEKIAYFGLNHLFDVYNTRLKIIHEYSIEEINKYGIEYLENKGQVKENELNEKTLEDTLQELNIDDKLIQIIGIKNIERMNYNKLKLLTSISTYIIEKIGGDKLSSLRLDILSKLPGLRNEYIDFIYSKIDSIDTEWLLAYKNISIDRIKPFGKDIIDLSLDELSDINKMTIKSIKEEYEL